MTILCDHSDSCGIRDSLPAAEFKKPLGNELVSADGLWSDLYKALGSELALIEAVDGYAIASAVLLQPRWIGDRTERSIEVNAIGRESEPKKVALWRALCKAVIGKIRKLVRCEIHDANRLPGTGIGCAVAVVEKCCVVASGVDRDGGGKSVGLLRIARHALGQTSPRGQYSIVARRRGLR